MMFTWWIAGIPYDILHGISNFAACLVLYKPLMYACGHIRKLTENKHDRFIFYRVFYYLKSIRLYCIFI